MLALESHALAVERRVSLPGMARGLGLSADGQRLYVSLSDRVMAANATTGAELGSIAHPGAEHVELVGPVLAP